MVGTQYWNVRLLSEYGLSAADGSAITLSTRKSLALLAYLVRQPERRASRERLASLLWEDAAPPQARLNLRKALSTLRQESRLPSHPDAILLEANNDTVWLVPGAIVSDVEAFEGAATAAPAEPGTAAKVAALYTGDFLSDFAVRGATTFEAWAEVERQHLRELAIRSLVTLMELALQPGSAPETGVVAAMRVLTFDPLQERAHRALMHFYLRQGRPTAALKQFHTLTEQLARDLGTSPEAETRELFREISASRHVRSSVARPPPAVLDHPADNMGTPASSPPAPRPRHRALAIAAAAIVGAGAIGSGLMLVNRSQLFVGLFPAPQNPSIAVLPFTGSGSQTEMGLFADGLTEELTNSLVQYADLKVSGRTSAFYYKDRGADLREIGRKLGVNYVVKGSVRREGDRLRVTAQLVEVANGYAIWSATYDRPLSDAYAIQEEVARNVAGELKAGLGGRQPAVHVPDGRAYQLYLVARANLRNGGKSELATARRLFEQQLVIDPNDPRALAGYAEATIGLARQFQLPFDVARKESEAAVERALRIDPRLAEAYLARSQIEHVAAAWSNQPGHTFLALDAAKRAVELAPRNPDALGAFGLKLIDHGRPDEAIEVLQRAVALDPLHRSAQAQLGKAYRSAGLFDQAARQYRTVIDLFPDYPDARILLGQVMYERSDVVTAERYFHEAINATGSPSAAIYCATLYANLQMSEAARTQLRSIQAPAMMAAVGRMLELHLAQDYRGALAHAEAEVSRDPDSPLRDIIYADTAILGDYAKSRRQMAEVAPGLLSAEPDFAAAALDMAVIGAHVLNHTGERAQARKVIARTLTLAAPRPGRESLPWEWFARINSYAELGQYDRALAELRRAIDSGYHDRVDDSILVRIEDWPSLRPLRNDVRFQRMIAEIEVRNGNLRGKLLASRPRPQPSPKAGDQQPPTARAP